MPHLKPYDAMPKQSECGASWASVPDCQAWLQRWIMHEHECSHLAGCFFCAWNSPFKTSPPPVGASLLAIAVHQSAHILNVTPSSRASSLPQGIGGGGHKSLAQKKHPVGLMPIS